jgi:N-acetylmuramoyl-L-alanine amidase
MRLAAFRLAIFVAFVPALLAVREPPARLPPTRPASATTAPIPPSAQLAALPSTRIGGVDFVSLRDIGALLGWRAEWQEPNRRLVLSAQEGRVEMTAGSRESIVNGLRLLLGTPALARSHMLYISKTDWQRCLMPLLHPAFLGPLLGRPRIIAIDPGHGGQDNGFENKPLRLKEKVLTLDVALRLKKLLEARGYTVVLTRTDDRMLGPDKQSDFTTRKRADFMTRWDITNSARADLFVSIHFNSLFPDTKTGGTEVYTFPRAGQRSDPSWGFGAKDDAEPTPSEVNRFDPWSSLLAQSLHRKVTSTLKTIDRGQKTMHLAVLRGLKCPAVLVESVFLSNEAEARRAATPAYLQQIAEGLADGIELYADTLQQIQPKPPRVAPSPSR